jgi:3-hydroxyacyl-[acyl-carrier-protein] dehydratase
MPVFPGVMIIEAMAQTAGVLVGVTKNLIDANAKVFFMSIDGTKFRRKVGPGDMLEMRLTALRGGGKVWKFEGKAYVGGDLACESTLTAMFEG